MLPKHVPQLPVVQGPPPPPGPGTTSARRLAALHRAARDLFTYLSLSHLTVPARSFLPPRRGARARVARKAAVPQSSRPPTLVGLEETVFGQHDQACLQACAHRACCNPAVAHCSPVAHCHPARRQRAARRDGLAVPVRPVLRRDYRGRRRAVPRAAIGACGRQRILPWTAARRRQLHGGRWGQLPNSDP